VRISTKELIEETKRERHQSPLSFTLTIEKTRAVPVFRNIASNSASAYIGSESDGSTLKSASRIDKMAFQ
jgi:hypothetical protein